MTKRLSKEDKAKRKQQKPPSETVKTFTTPKPEGQPVNLCDDCAYEVRECEGKPKFASDQDATLTGAAADCVIECPAFVNVAAMPTVQDLATEDTIPEIVIVCSGGCGNTTEGMTKENASGILSHGVHESGKGTTVLVWTCQECLDKKQRPAAAHGGDGQGPAKAEEKIQIPIEETEGTEREVTHEFITAEPTSAPAPGQARPDPKRFFQGENFGICPSCQEPLKRTAFNRYQDAVRCTKSRCRAYRVIVAKVTTGVI